MATKKAPPQKKVAPKKAPPRPPPPKKKKKIVKRAVGVEIMKATDLYTEIPHVDKASYAYLRFAAGMHYSTDLNGTTVAAMAQHPVFRRVPLSTLTEWCAHDKWADRRREVLSRWREQIESRIGDALVRQRLESVKKMEAIRDHIFKRLTPLDHEYVSPLGHDFQPETKHDIRCCDLPMAAHRQPCVKCGVAWNQHFDPFAGVSGDKAVEALTKMLRLELELSELILSVTQTPGYGANAAAGNVRPRTLTSLNTPKLTQSEARSAALAILKERQK